MAEPHFECIGCGTFCLGGIVQNGIVHVPMCHECLRLRVDLTIGLPALTPQEMERARRDWEKRHPVDTGIAA